MRRTLTLLGLSALTLALAAPAALARGPGFGPGPGPDGFRGRGARIIEALDLSPEQTTAFRQLRDAQREQAHAIHEQIRAKREQLRDLWKAGASRAQIVALTQEINGLHAQLRLNRVDFMFDVKGLLTPEQFTKFIDLRGAGPMGRRGMRGHGPRHGMRGHGPRDGWGPGCPFGPDDAPAPEDAE